uniref:Glutathione S-transferase rho n=1 Tax=Astyanax mexicanus TaxID=7994 RepID=A0A3B1ISQ2_ASTMX
MAEDMLLFWASGSPPCWRVMIALEEKNLQGYKNKHLSYEKNEHKNPDVLQINPRGQIPTFKHGDVVVNESIAACLYLQNPFKSQGTQLMPDSVSQQALVLQRMLEAEALQKKIYDVLFYEYYVPEAERHESLKLWESYLQQMGKGSYLTGKDFSLADVAMFPDLAYLPRFGTLRKERYPRLMEYYEMVKERPSVKASWPPTWREKEKEQDTLKDL